MPGKQLRNQEGLPQRDWDEWISERSLRASLRRVKRLRGWYIGTAKCSLPPGLPCAAQRGVAKLLAIKFRIASAKNRLSPYNALGNVLRTFRQKFLDVSRGFPDIVSFEDIIMPKGLYIGEFEQLILLAVLRLGQGAYGSGIREEIIARTGRSISRGALYAGLDRLEEKGLLKSWLGAPTAERGGRAKRHYEMTGNGELALSTSLHAVKRMAAGLRIPFPA